MKPLTRFLIAFAFLATLLLPQRADAQVRNFRWLQYDVDLSLNEDGSMDVVEQMEIQFSGFYTQGFVTINTGNLGNNDGITNIAVSGNGVSYARAGGSAAGTYKASQSGDVVGIDWFFPEPSTGIQRYELSYTVEGVVRVADDGDQLLWRAIREEHAGAIDSSRVTLRMPDGVPALSTTARFNNQEGQNVTTTVENGGAVVIFQTTRPLSYNQPLDVGVRWEHGLLTIAEPDWQASRRWNDVLSLLLIAGSILLLLAIVLGTFLLWYLRGRDPEPDMVPDILETPPDNLSPGVVGTLVDEKADLHDILAMLVDLARRGYIEMEETKRSFVFRRGEKPWEGLEPYESLLLNKVFGRKQERKLSDLKQRFYKHLPAIRQSLYEDLETRKLIDRSPESVRNRYRGAGIALLALGIGGVFLVIAVLESDVTALVCPSVTLAIGGLLLLGVSGAMPRKTQAGSLAAARWQAFKKYLEEVRAFDDVPTAQERFEAYLPYAIAFGLERRWLDKFKQQPEIIPPPWYIPYPRAPRRTVLGGGPGRAGAPAGAPSLDRMAGGLGGGLDNMAGSLTRMLDSTAKTMRSTPPSSSSGSSGGGFSGGFSGGSSGGGSSGFR